MQKFLVAATVLFGSLATTAHADFVLNPTQVGQSGVVNYNGIVEGNVVPGLSASITFTLDSVNFLTNTWSFDYALDNTTSGGLSSRVSVFGFSTNPDFLSASITGGTVFTGASSGNVPQLGPVDFCATAGPNCAGGSGGGVFPGDGIVTGSFDLDFAGSATLATQIAFSDLFVRYQSITGTAFGDSGIGIPPPGTTPFGVVPIPGPVVGAGLPALVTALFGLLGFRHWRRRRITA